MSPISVALNTSACKRLQAYLESSLFTSRPTTTDHWGKRIPFNSHAFSVTGENVLVSIGDSGLTDIYRQNFKKPSRLFSRSPKRRLLNLLGCHSTPAYNPGYFFNQFWPPNSRLLSLADIRTEYGDVTDAGIYKAFHFFNEIEQVTTEINFPYQFVLEIGPGPGNLLRLIKSYHSNAKIVIVDLPTSIPYSFCHLAHVFPNATFCLPNEIDSRTRPLSTDFSFLTPAQSGEIPNSSIDLAINTMSFQEMRPSVIHQYFVTLRNILKERNLFYCVNAVQKPMTFDQEEVPVRFSEYPWMPEDSDYRYQISPVEIGRTYKPFFVRACRLKKPNTVK
jgi:hypothetical protein